MNFWKNLALAETDFGLNIITSFPERSNSDPVIFLQVPAGALDKEQSKSMTDLKPSTVTIGSRFRAVLSRLSPRTSRARTSEATAISSDAPDQIKLSPVEALHYLLKAMAENNTADRMHDDGPYRVPGSSESVKLLQNDVIAGRPINIAEIRDVDVIASAVKALMLEAMPALVSPGQLAPVQNAIESLGNKSLPLDTRVTSETQLLECFTPQGKEVFELLRTHLREVSKFCATNKMTITNLAISILGPKLTSFFPENPLDPYGKTAVCNEAAIFLLTPHA